MVVEYKDEILVKEYKAKRILKGDENHKVLYNNKEVWIEDIDRSSNEALVSVIGTNETFRVPISQLDHKGIEIK